MKRHEKQFARTLIDALDGATMTQVQTTAQELVHELAQRSELYRIRGIIEAIEGAWSAKYAAATVTIETAHELTAALRKKLEALTPGAEIRERVRPEIIGGARLRIDETILDGSIEGHLAQLNVALRNA